MEKTLASLLAILLCLSLTAPALAAEQGYKVLYQSELNFRPWSSYGDFVAGYSSDSESCRILRWTGSSVEETPTSYRYAQLESERYAIVNYSQVIDLRTGETVVPQDSYDSISVNGLYAMGRKDRDEGRELYLLDLANGGEPVRLPDGAQSFGDGRILIQEDVNHNYYTDMKGNRVMTLKEGVRPHSYTNGYTAVMVVQDLYLAGYAIMGMDGMYTATFSHPRFVLGDHYPTVYYLDAPDSYVSHEGLICIGERTENESTCERYGYADIQGKIVIPCEYTRESHAFRNGYAVVIKGVGQERQCGLIDITGRTIIPMGAYQALSDVSSSGILWAQDHNGRLCVLEVPVTGLIDAPYAAYYGEAVRWGMDTGILEDSIYRGGVYGPLFKPNEESYILAALGCIWNAKGKPAPAVTPELVEDDGDGINDLRLMIQWSKEQGLTWGDGSDDLMDGVKPITRGQMMFYLWKLAGSPAAGTVSFTDVPAGSEYAQAVAWAVERGITSGTGNGAFSPEQHCTRGQVITFVYRAMSGK